MKGSARQWFFFSLSKIARGLRGTQTKFFVAFRREIHEFKTQ